MSEQRYSSFGAKKMNLKVVRARMNMHQELLLFLLIEATMKVVQDRVTILHPLQATSAHFYACCTKMYVQMPEVKYGSET